MADSDDPARTIIQPRQSGSEAAAADSSSLAHPELEAPCTDDPAEQKEQMSPREENVTSPASQPPSAPEGASAALPQITIGAVLNHIYRVDRFIARGGMGEVYEGTNVTNPEDRVAIKIILPQLAADPNILALFRSEARALTKLSHPGLVQYRLLAQEPQLNVLYIVTEFVDGPALSEVLTSLNVTPEELVQLIRRLASALAAAHALDKIHRDISPDNILLPHRKLDEAKIIDFGIAKDLAAAKGAKTIIGSGFAGKLGYVAPEQFGDTRDVGPWTDVYSLGLVALAVASRHAPDMGATYVEALEKRRAVPDVSATPQWLQPVLTRMLEPDRTKRFQSMNDLVAAIDAIPRRQLHGTLQPASAPRPVATARTEVAGGSRVRMVLAALGGAVLVAAVLIAVVTRLSSPSPSPVTPPLRPAPAARPVPAVAVTTDAEKVRAFVAASLPRIGCSWLDSQNPVATPKGVLVRLSGVAANPDNLLSDVTQRTGIKSIVDSSGVSQVQVSSCNVLDIVRSFRAPASYMGEALHVQRTPYHLLPNPEGCPQAPSARIVADWKTPDPSADFYLGEVESSGRIGVIFPSHAEFSRAATLRPLEAGADGPSFHTTICVDDQMAQRSPISGVLLISGKGPFDLGPMPQLDSLAVSSNWLARFAKQAKQRGWTTQMAWFRVELPETLSGTPNVVDTATFMIDGYHVHMAGIEGLTGQFAEKLRAYIGVLGNAVTCARIGDGPFYRCLTASQNLDVSNFVLRNGAARAIATATALQITNQQMAKDERKGIWGHSRH